MPELPEVETVRLDLEKAIVGLKFTDVEVFLPKMLKNTKAKDLVRILKDAKITGVDRRGKIILVRLSSGYTIMIHLKMSGQLLYMDADDPIGKWTHIIFGLSNGHLLHLRDQRQFGYVKVIKTEDADRDPTLTGMGPEPFSGAFNVAYLKEKFKRRKKARIKAVLLDQSVIAGIGNIYADEILHEARIRPTRSPNDLTRHEIEALHSATLEILKSAIENRGSSFSKYVDLSGEQGGYVKHHRVYRREGELCFRNDGGTIKRIKIAGRSTFYCPVCQK
ncbi:MAG: bifunctional DNA-formamidopyrimidine glycosylase/DNA-(apurinic or apyrimidinic site) lyase [Bacteroidetes bacterium]|nr:bifunctional DNA-formamidopyrimidine glycosylase/DNA-(apurinic or apyrimidinic site) lyase [Bacteroidota bacterium]